MADAAGELLRAAQPSARFDAAATLRKLDKRVPRAGLQAWYHKAGYDAVHGVWRDVSGAGVSTGSVLTGSPAPKVSSGHGATGSVWHLAGGLGSSIAFTDVVPARQFTLCSGIC